jgi:hypothetical protein
LRGGRERKRLGLITWRGKEIRRKREKKKEIRIEENRKKNARYYLYAYMYVYGEGTRRKRETAEERETERGGREKKGHAASGPITRPPVPCIRFFFSIFRCNIIPSTWIRATRV